MNTHGFVYILQRGDLIKIGRTQNPARRLTLVYTVVDTLCPAVYTTSMFQIIESEPFKTWINHLRDKTAKLRINSRLEKVKLGSLGDVKPVGGGVSEMRIHYAKGYRVYFILIAQVVLVLLCGGDKSNQKKDIKQAKVLAKQWRQKNEK